MAYARAWTWSWHGPCHYHPLSTALFRTFGRAIKKEGRGRGCTSHIVHTYRASARVTLVGQCGMSHGRSHRRRLSCCALTLVVPFSLLSLSLSLLVFIALALALDLTPFSRSTFPFPPSLSSPCALPPFLFLSLSFGKPIFLVIYHHCKRKRIPTASIVVSFRDIASAPISPGTFSKTFLCRSLDPYPTRTSFIHFKAIAPS